MDRKALAYSAVLLLSLVIVSVLVNRSMVRAVLDPADITLTLAPFATSTTSTLDQVREFKGELDFPDEDATVSLLEFIITSSTVTTTHFYLPLPTTSSTTTIQAPFPGQPPSATGTLVVTVQLVNVFPTSSTTTGSTLPGSTLPGSGQAYKGIGAGAKIIYCIKWTPPNNAALLGDHQAVLRAHVVAPGGAGSIHTTAPVTFTLLPVSIQTVFIPLQQGFNLITLPVDPGPINSRQILDEINTQGGAPCANAIPVFRCVIQAVEWNSGTQAFVFNTVASELGKFDVVPGKGFFVNVPTVPPSGGWDVTGTPIPAPVDLTFVQGFNLVGIPVATPGGGYDSRQFLDEINTQGGAPCANAIPVFRCAIQAVEWNAGTQAFVFNTVASESGKFTITAIKGFFVNVPTVPPAPTTP